MRKQVLLIIFMLRLFDGSFFRVIFAKLFFKRYLFQLSIFFEVTVHETRKLALF